MNSKELDLLVAQIGEELLARVGPAAAPSKQGEGLNLPDQVCPGCVQRCVQTCARNSREIIAAGAARVLGQRAAHQDRSVDRRISSITPF